MSEKGKYVIYLDTDGLKKEEITTLETEILKRCEEHGMTPLILNRRASILKLSSL